MPRSLRIGTRSSPLALWQANHVARALRTQYSGLHVELVQIQTQGDAILHASLASIGGRGVFTREIEHALLQGAVDIAVHSLKDLPTILPEGLCIAAIPVREDPRDAFIAKQAKSLQALPEGAKVATGSLRRRAQILHHRPDVEIADIRGNVGTRLRKFAESDCQGMILARAGLVRLGWENRISDTFEPEEMLSAVGQGALAVQIRSDDSDLMRNLAFLDNDSARWETTAERAFLHRLEGGCQIPVAARAIFQNSMLHLDGLVASLDGTDYYRRQEFGRASDAEEMGVRLAESLLQDGAKSVLEKIRNG